MRSLTPAVLPTARPRWRRPSPRWVRAALRHGRAALLLALLAGGGFWLWRTGALAQTYAWTQAAAVEFTAALGLRVADVVVEGRNETRPEAVLEALGVRRGMPLFALDLGAAKARLEALPWVRTGSIERRWPHLVYVRIEERTPLALWQHAGVIRLIDAEGTVIAGVDIRRFADLPMVVGEGAPSHTPAFLAMLAKEPELARHVAAAVWVGNRRWNLRLQEGIDVRLPESNPEAALGRLATLEAKERIFARDIVIIDMRLSDRLIVRLAPNAAARAIKPGRST